MNHNPQPASTTKSQQIDLFDDFFAEENDKKIKKENYSTNESFDSEEFTDDEKIEEKIEKNNFFNENFLIPNQLRSKVF